jgi:energy-converting hydrogenase Eha subunit G
MQIRSFIQKVEEANYSFHRMVELEVIKTKSTFMKVELFIY